MHQKFFVIFTVIKIFLRKSILNEFRFTIDIITTFKGTFFMTDYCDFYILLSKRTSQILFILTNIDLKKTSNKFEVN